MLIMYLATCVSHLAIAAALVSHLASATICTSSIAVAVSPKGGSSGIDAIIQSDSNCAAVAAVGTSSCSRKRDSTELECNPGEMCILYGTTVLLCLEAVSGMFCGDHSSKCQSRLIRPRQATFTMSMKARATRILANTSLPMVTHKPSPEPCYQRRSTHRQQLRLRPLGPPIRAWVPPLSQLPRPHQTQAHRRRHPRQPVRK